MGWSVSHIPWSSCYFSGTGQGKEFSLVCEGEPTALLCSLGGRPGLFACACPALTHCSECSCGVWNIYYSGMWFCDRNWIVFVPQYSVYVCYTYYFWTCLLSAETNFSFSSKSFEAILHHCILVLPSCSDPDLVSPEPTPHVQGFHTDISSIFQLIPGYPFIVMQLFISLAAPHMYDWERSSASFLKMPMTYTEHCFRFLKNILKISHSVCLLYI